MFTPEASGRFALGLILLAILGLGFMHQTAARKPADGKSWAVSTASAMVRIGRLETSPRSTACNLRAARGEYVACQIVVMAGEMALTGVNVEMTDLMGSDGARVSKQNLMLYREHYIQVTSPSPDPGWGNRPLGAGWYPDALIPMSSTAAAPVARGFAGVPFDVAIAANQPLWVDIHVPLDALPGTYTGTVTIAAGNERQDAGISLRVRNFGLPLKPTLQSSFGMHEPGLRDRRLHEMLLEHRVMPESVNPEDAQALVENFGLNTTGLRFWSQFEKRGCTMDPPPPPAVIASAFRQYPAGLDVHLYSADEIDVCPGVFGKVRQWAAAMHTANPQIRNLVTVAPQAPLFSDGGNRGQSGVDIWALLPKIWETSAHEIEEARARGGQIWGYTALVQEAYSPKWEIDFLPVDYRILPGFLARVMGLTGILYWRVELWTKSPFEDLRGYSIDGKYYPGEGMLVYPATDGTGSYIPSMRLKWIRQGVQDFEYAAILSRMGQGDWAMSRVRRVAENWHKWTRDTDLLDSVRDELGDEIERLTALLPQSANPVGRTSTAGPHLPGTYR